MSARDPVEGYVLHTYGSEQYLQHAVASVLTLRRHDTERPVALYCPTSHRRVLEQFGLDTLFHYIGELPPEHQSIIGFKHHLDAFMPFERCLFVDADMVWCRDPNPLWQQLAPYTFTATGEERADAFFGGPKHVGIIIDFVLDRRRRTMRRFGLSYLPRIQAGMIYAQDATVTRTVCDLAAGFLARQQETHFRSRIKEGRLEESCEWSLAMAMSRLTLPVYPWFQTTNSPQLDFVEGLTTYDPDFTQVTCRYYCNPLVRSIRGLPTPWFRTLMLAVFTRLPGRGDWMNVTPVALHFGWLYHKQPFQAFSQRIWDGLTAKKASYQTASPSTA